MDNTCHRRRLLQGGSSILAAISAGCGSNNPAEESTGTISNPGSPSGQNTPTAANTKGGNQSSNQETQIQNRSLTLLGDFESGLDGWETNGENELSRVTNEERVGVATRGDAALQVTVNGDSFPMIENSIKIQNADFESSPYLLLDIVPGSVPNSESAITFQFKLYHRTSDQKTRLTAKSQEKEVEQYFPTPLGWDLSDVKTRKLNAATRLEVTWHPTEIEPESGPRGTNDGFNYQSQVSFDNIRLADCVAQLHAIQKKAKLTRLKAERGIIIRVEPNTLTNTTESGEILFDDNSTVNYEMKKIEEQKIEYSIGNETFKLGSGWCD